MARVVLIAEDEPRNMILARDILQAEGYATIEAVDGRQAVELTMAHKPDLVLMDLQLPVMNGLEATRQLKNHAATRHIPVVALTASAMEDDKHQVLDAGCDGYITKPIDIGDFLDKVAAHLARERTRPYNEGDVT